jgi:hypothetical protein
MAGGWFAAPLSLWTGGSKTRTWAGWRRRWRREALERVQNLSLEVSEEIDAYQIRYGG